MLLLALLLAFVVPPHAFAVASERGSWRWPLRGEVLTPFRIAANPFAAGQHRGIDIAAVARAPVVSTCAGRVSFAGPVPGRGRAVTVVCGPLVATYLELGSVAVERDDDVAAGDRIGRVAASHLQLGARRTGERHGYIDPLTLLRDRGRPPPLGASPRRSPPSRPRAPFVPRPASRPAPARSPVRGGVPLSAWLGLALFAGGMPLGAVVRRRRRRRTSLELRAADEGA